MFLTYVTNIKVFNAKKEWRNSWKMEILGLENSGELAVYVNAEA